MPKLRPRTLALALSALVAAALALALLDLRWPSRGGAPEVVAVVDVSDSVDPAALAAQLDALADLERRGDFRFVAFADRPLVFAELTGLRSLRVAAPGEPDARGALQRDESRLAPALELAAGAFASDRPRRLLLLSDGAETGGDAFATLPRLIEGGIEVHSRRLPRRGLPPRIVELGAPGLPVRAGEPALVSLRVTGSTGEELALVVEAAGREVHRSLLAADPEPRRMEIEATFDEPGAHRLRARIEGAAGVVHGVERTVAVGPRRRVLLASGGAPLAPLGTALERLGWDVTIRIAADLPVAAAAYRPWDVVLLDDVEARALGVERMTALREWVVERGGGLFFASGPATYGEEGYSESPLEGILPMRFNVEEEKTDVALMIALDKSYSMRGEKMELAKEAAKAVVRELDAEHRFGLVSFDWNPFNVVPLQPVLDGGDIVERIGRIEASAQTNFYPALQMCQNQLREVEAEVKHVILVSDGKTYPDEYQRLIAEMREDEITVSTVAVGAEADRELLAEIARWGDGSSYFVQDASKVQSILLDEARSKTEKTLVEKSVVVLEVGASPVLDGIDVDAAPALLGRVNLETSERGEVVLESADGRPLLASRNAGLGRTWMAAFDVDGRWTGGWTGWPGFARLVSQALRDAARSVPPLRDLRVEERGEAVRVVLEARRPDGSWDNGLDLSLTLARRPTGDAAAEPLSPAPLRQVAPGRYRAELVPELSPGDELLIAVEGPEGPTHASLVRAVSPEERPAPDAGVRLAELAAATGGTAEGPLGRVLEPAPPRARRSRPLWPLLAWTALVVYLLELALRRSGLLRRLAGRGAVG
ncbi:MAG TPA: VWA domain-containing protein [Thermoanaerobaculia bacterium]|nr:VWA domain-containing protein [Thermoanaerobaculia bacterium]